jgi:predicted ATPase/DNA-binding NarL/FixJ family response regulator
MTLDTTALAGRLPAEPNSFIGRERDLADLADMLGPSGWVRALTLCGPGGIGKTRLALRLAVALQYPDGAWFADLADIEPVPVGGAHGSLVALLTAALGIREEPDRPLADTLCEALRARALLLVLDTCDHLVTECADVVHRLLGECPGVRVIATSREPLRVRGEMMWRVPPLGLPVAADALDGSYSAAAAAASESVQLFLARAATVRPGLAIDEVNVATIAGICRTLDGVPLAIELAAARLRALSVEQISERLTDKFSLLASGDRTAPPRQQTLRAAVEWSHDLLTESERLLLRRLSVFHGWSLPMAERICPGGPIDLRDVLELLTALIDKSLVSLDGELGGEARYRLLDTVRELAVEQAATAGETPGLRRSHRDCMLEIAEDVASRAFVRGEPSWPQRVAMYHRVRADRANFHQALAWCTERGDADEGLRLCNSLSGSWLASGDLADGAAWLDQLLTVTGPVQAGVRARGHAVRAELAFEQQDYDQATRHAQACLTLSTATEGNPAAALRLLALLGLQSGRAQEALDSADAAVAAARQMPDAWEEGVALASRAVVLASQGSLARAEEAYQEALDVLKDNNGWGVANVLYRLGRLARSRDDPDEAVRYFSEALVIYRQIDARPEMARCLAGIGWVRLAAHDLDGAWEHLTESMRLSLVTGQRLPIARGLSALAVLCSAAGDPARATIIASSAIVVFEAVGARSSAAAARLDAMIAAARGTLGTAAVTTLVAEGARLSPQQAAHLAAESAGAMASSPGCAWPGPLTAREREVARLVAAGLSNRAIGAQLFITEATAARHVANIFAKLGFSSRAQLVAWVDAEPPEVGAGSAT